ncbi:hypothetical protein DFP72DRAFT_957018 [Ephemerocybe angulata]|uniref:HMG box domain-containing protein n=1 Tax=Ephemerocybe angulata TaxID=980116 RepID=A0A8H6ICE9_9AGAR|nr:hypothetical protein DFP72DRAFT_957018 [Tulosesus angulatus]
MTKIDLQEFDDQRGKLVQGLVACAEQLRNTAKVVEDFAQYFNSLDGDGKGKRKELVFEDGDGSKKRKRSVKPKDPNAPKRPASSYILFQNDIRKKLRAQFPDLTNPALLTMISEKWKNMTEEEKQPYNQQMLAAKGDYTEKKFAYDNRSAEQVEADNKVAADAAAEAAATKKGSRGRSKKEEAAPSEVKARPPPPAADTEAESDEEVEVAESDEESEEEESAPSKPSSKHARKQVDSSDGETDSASEDEEEESEPAPKRSKRSGSVQPVQKASKKNKA